MTPPHSICASCTRALLLVCPAPLSEAPFAGKSADLVSILVPMLVEPCGDGPKVSNASAQFIITKHVLSAKSPDYLGDFNVDQLSAFKFEAYLRQTPIISATTPWVATIRIAIPSHFSWLGQYRLINRCWMLLRNSRARRWVLSSFIFKAKHRILETAQEIQLILFCRHEHVAVKHFEK